MRLWTFGLRAAVVAVALSGLSACSAQYRTHGYIPPEEDLDAIVVGVDTRDTVAETVGTPSTAGLSDASGFYFVESRVRQFGWREPEEVSREVLAISFDDTGTVRNIERFGLEEGRVVTLNRRVTESGGSVGFLRQLLRRIGAFAPEDFID
jgi:outer membrane protein assembly factor BamE (lipoprotein component of BamABCDE complex)